MLGVASRAVVAASLLLACSHPHPPREPHSPKPPKAESGYTIIEPDVSTNVPSSSVTPAPALDPNEDAMAGILAIPPGN